MRAYCFSGGMRSILKSTLAVIAAALLLAACDLNFRRRATAAAAGGSITFVHGLLRLGLADFYNLSPQALNTLQQAATAYKTTRRCTHHCDRPYRYVGTGKLQHGAVAAPCERSQGCLG